MTREGRLESSFRDPSGFVFTRDGSVYRQINRPYAATYDQLLECGLYDRLVDLGLLVPHDEVDLPPEESDAAYKIIQPRRIDFISYPYEWCFSALRAAAECTLQVQREALAHGMTLKDASAYNIQFQGVRPIFIDTLSFEPYIEGRPWVAYRQFCAHFLAPLALMARRNISLGSLLQRYLDGIALDLASGLLPRRTWMEPGLLMHVHLHARSQQRHADDAQADGMQDAARAQSAKLSRAGMTGILDSLQKAVRKQRWHSGNTEWAAYYEETNYNDAAMNYKCDRISRYLNEIKPATLWDVGANTGRFSRLASDRNVPTIAIDADPAAVDALYRTCVEENVDQILPLVVDVTNPSPALGWSNAERASLSSRGPADMALALALVHHLAIGNNVPLPNIARYFAGLCRTLVIEFVPKEDSQVQRLLATREDVFPDYASEAFRQAFETHFTIRDVSDIPDSSRTLFLMTRNADPV